MEAMEHAVYTDEVQHIIIDNLQFMMPPQQHSSSEVGGDGAGGAVEDSGGADGSGSSGTAAKGSNEKFELQDLAVARLRRFASEKDVSVPLRFFYFQYVLLFDNALYHQLESVKH